MFFLDDYQRYEKSFNDLQDKNITLTSIRDNLIDMIWDDEQPPYPDTVLLTMDAEKYTGQIWFYVNAKSSQI